jgi:hypothetical protein
MPDEGIVIQPHLHHNGIAQPQVFLFLKKFRAPDIIVNLSLGGANYEQNPFQSSKCPFQFLMNSQAIHVGKILGQVSIKQAVHYLVTRPTSHLMRSGKSYGSFSFALEKKLSQ